MFSKVRLSFKAHGIPNKDISSKTDPFLVIYSYDKIKGRRLVFIERGRFAKGVTLLCLHFLYRDIIEEGSRQDGGRHGLLEC